MALFVLLMKRLMLAALVVIMASCASPTSVTKKERLPDFPKIKLPIVVKIQ